MPEITLPIRRRGALVKVLVRAAAARAGGGAAAPAGPLLAYLDTGASDTMVDVGVARGLGPAGERTAALSVLGREEVSFHEARDVEVALLVPGEAPRWVPLSALCGPVCPAGVAVALGRDFLRHVTFTYDGPGGKVRLCW